MALVYSQIGGAFAQTVVSFQCCLVPSEASSQKLVLALRHEALRPWAWPCRELVAGEFVFWLVSGLASVARTPQSTVLFPTRVQ